MLAAIALIGYGSAPVPAMEERTTAEFAIAVPSHWVQRDVADTGRLAPLLAANRELFPGMDDGTVRRLLGLLNSFFAEDPIAPASVAVNRVPLGIDGEVARLERSSEVRTMSRRSIVLTVGPALEYKWGSTFTMPSGQRVAFAYTNYYLQSPWQATYVLHFGSTIDRGDADAPLFERIAASFRWAGPERFVGRGFSVLAPGGEGWLPLKRGPDSPSWLRRKRYAHPLSEVPPT